MKRLHRKSKLHFSILREIAHSGWAGYKAVLLELSERPFFDISALRMSVELFDIYLLDNLVHIYNSYFLSQMDVEVIYSESSNWDLDFFLIRRSILTIGLIYLCLIILNRMNMKFYESMSLMNGDMICFIIIDCFLGGLLN